ncbi:TPA: hypothetical protein ACYSQW_002288 [Yersinia enterocolitica]
MTLVDNNMPEDMIKNVNGDYLKTYIALITKTKNTAETLEKNKKNGDTVLLINHMASQPDDKGLIADNLSHNHYQAMADMANLVPSM